jgi:hypothetical protein
LDNFEQKIIDLYIKDKFGSITISRLMNITKTKVLKILKNNNIQRRSTSEAGKLVFKKGYVHPMTGSKLSEQHKIKMQEGRKDVPSWNLGLTKKEDARLNGGRKSKGAFFDKTSGYILIYRNNKIQKFHRILWEEKYGEIPEGYVVHHIDGNKINNDMNNLRLLSVEEHTKLHWSQKDIRGAFD